MSARPSIALSHKFRRARFAKRSTAKARTAYSASRNGSFYNGTYVGIRRLFSSPSSSTAQRLAACWSWMGSFKPTNISRLATVRGLRLPALRNLWSTNVSVVVATYTSVEAVLGSVGATKFLHFAYPSTYVMWDHKIQQYAFGFVLGSHGQSKAYRAFLLALASKVRRASSLPRGTIVLPLTRALDVWLWHLSR